MEHMHEEFATVTVTYEEETGVGTILLNRPDTLNALNTQLRSDIKAGLERLESQNEHGEGVQLRVVVMEGSGEKAFCAGADINEFSDRTSGGSSERPHYEFIREFPTPVVAKIDGYCLGGGFETALCSDFRFASERSTFGFPEVDLGLLPGAGGAHMVEKLAGPGVAKELAMTGKHITAGRANDEGLVHDVYSTDELDDEVRRFAEDIAAQAPLAVQRIKKSVNLSGEIGLEEGCDYDSQGFSVLLGTDDVTEGTQAFAEDREPQFEGR